MTNPNPNEPTFPFSGGTDNPGDDTSKPGGPTNVASTETAPLLPVPHVAGVVNAEGIHPPVVAGLSSQGTDTPLGALQAVPPTGDGFESAVDRGPDPEGGIDPVTGSPREAGQDETAGATETTSGETPGQFPSGMDPLPLSEIIVGSGWHILAGSVVEIGDVSTLYLQFAFDAAAAAVAVTLPERARPPVDDVVSNSGLFTLDAEDGTITYSGSTASANGGPVICEMDEFDPRSRY